MSAVGDAVQRAVRRASGGAAGPGHIRRAAVALVAALAVAPSAASQHTAPERRSAPGDVAPSAAATERGRAAENGPPVAAALAPAIGRLNHAGYRRSRHCTAFLVAPREIVTARHCITGIDPAGMHFLAGYERMRWAEHLRPETVEPGPDDLDVVHICLDRAAAAAPLPLAGEPVAVGEAVLVLGYGAPGVHRLNRNECTIRAVEGTRSMLLDCALTPGNSGAPVLRADADGKLAVVGVVSRTGPHASIADAVPTDGTALACAE